MDITQQFKAALQSPSAYGQVKLPASLFSDGDAFITEKIVVPQNVYYITPDGKDKRRIRLSTPEASISVTNKDFLIIQNLILVSDTGNTSANLIEIHDSSRVRVTGCSFEGIKNDQRGIALIAQNKDIDGNLIESCSFQFDPSHVRNSVGIRVIAYYTGDDYDTAWKKNKTSTRINHPNKNAVIRNCTFNGGAYGIYASGMLGGFIEWNRFTDQIIPVMFDFACSRVNIHNNAFIDHRAVALRIKHVSTDNNIQFNHIRSTQVRENAESVVQFLFGSKRNVFSRNNVHVNDGQYMAYCAIHADGCVFINNLFEGNARKAIIAVEAAWNASEVHKSHTSSPLTGIFSEGTYDVRVQHNVVKATCETGVGIFYSGTNGIQLQVFSGNNEIGTLTEETYGKLSFAEIKRGECSIDGGGGSGNTGGGAGSGGSPGGGSGSGGSPGGGSTQPSLPAPRVPPTIQYTGYTNPPAAKSGSKPWNINTDVRPNDTATGYIVVQMQIHRPAEDSQQSYTGIR